MATDFCESVSIADSKNLNSSFSGFADALQEFSRCAIFVDYGADEVDGLFGMSDGFNGIFYEFLGRQKLIFRFHLPLIIPYRLRG